MRLYKNIISLKVTSADPDAKFGALAAWAWGYHHCVDALLQLGDTGKPEHRIPIDTAKIAIVGSSRGGKATHCSPGRLTRYCVSVRQ